MTPFLVRFIGIALLVAALILPMRYVLGQSLSLAVTPPLFQLTIGQGEDWSSSIKVVNNNPYEVTYYATVVNFDAQGEAGKGTFTPLIEGGDNSASLAGWVTLSKEPITLGKGVSGTIPFSVHVPENAAPGGHYAAILVGTQPGLQDSKESSVKVSSFVSSLLFVRIKGDVHESGRIREFRTSKAFYDTPHADFILRFENTGNTHLKPQGDITLYNMWGKERGKVFINQKSNFGNVLPQSVRKFEFSWEGTDDLFDIGRYSAEVTLAYGEDGKQSTTATSYFWIIPIVPVAGTIGSIAVFLVLVAWFVRRYIRRALQLEHEHLGIPLVRHSVPSFATLLEPLKEGVIDLRSATGTPMVGVTSRLTFGAFLRKYKGFFVFLVLICGGILFISLYFGSVLTSTRTYDIKVQPGEESSSTR